MKPNVSRAAILRAVLILSLFAGMGGRVGDAADAAQPRPILIELFTSEGCSSCPPVDAWVQRLDADQPLTSAQIIVLSEHVDYWDHEGWKDPFSSAQMMARQQRYEYRLGQNDVYTPQVILDGSIEVHPSQPEQVTQGFRRALGESMIPVRIESPVVEADDPEYLSGQVAIDATAEQHSGDVYVAVALNRTMTDVLAGENDGKKLTNVGVVKDLVRVGKLEKGKDFQQPFRVKLWEGVDPANLRVVAFVQAEGQGQVLGAAMTRQIGKE